LKDISATACLDLMDLLLSYGDNYLTLDYYLAYLLQTHHFALNRCQYLAAQSLEEVFELYL
jgi:hypothetical protein